MIYTYAIFIDNSSQRK